MDGSSILPMSWEDFATLCRDVLLRGGAVAAPAGRDTLNGPPAEASYPGAHLVSPQAVEEVETLSCCWDDINYGLRFLCSLVVILGLFEGDEDHHSLFITMSTIPEGTSHLLKLLPLESCLRNLKTNYIFK